MLWKSALTAVKCDCAVPKVKRVKERDYKAVRLQGIYYGAFFQDNLSLTDWVNSQRLTNPLICLGDSHDGECNLFQEIGTNQQRQEIQDLYHLNDFLYKEVGGSLKRLKQASSLRLSRVRLKPQAHCSPPLVASRLITFVPMWTSIASEL